MALQPNFEEILGCQGALFEWVESYDSKDWERLSRCIAPTLRIDYTSFLNKLWEDLPAAEFISMASNPHVLGNPLLKTQHFVGATKWVKNSDTEITGYHQMRVAHQKYENEDMKDVAVKGHAHGKSTICYRKLEGVWKFAGLEPDIRWSEYDHDKIFEHGREEGV
ncbi:unnamed protein product [Periconia digitata]|uniref:Scytalone dehydratase-like domain-containing protein n=1 Tax=Periconia digitata TaxID=1303443 RepID=A0A9W4XT93_9PLEO|nr:unnamed protein product [Periconia digitata]